MGRGFVGQSAISLPLHISDAMLDAMPTSDTTLTANTSADTKGSWVEVISATSATTGSLIVYVAGVGANGVNTSTLLDIGIGAAASEVVIAGDIAIGGANGVTFEVPVALNPGTRVAARIQSVVSGGKTALVRVGALSTPSFPRRPTGAGVDVLGTTTSGSTGTASSSSADTYVDVVTATSRPYAGVILVPSLATTAISSGYQVMTLGIGAAGAEQTLCALMFQRAASETCATPHTPPVIRRHIPTGSRLAMKTNVASSAFTACVIGIPY